MQKGSFSRLGGVNLGMPIGQWWTALLPWGGLALITFMLVKMVLRLVRS